MPLPDGTNKEREDICVPLPFQSKSDLTKVVLYGSHASPACCRVRALLHLAGFTSYERRFGRHPSSSYRKFPVITLGNDHDGETHQINDSHIIFKNLAPILFGDGYQGSDADLKVDAMVTYELMLSCEAEAFSNAECMKKWAITAGLGSGMIGFLVNHLPVVPMSFAERGADRIRDRHPDLKTPLEYCTLLKQELDHRGGLYFHGSKVGPLDAVIYGTMAVWAPGGNQSMAFMTDALSKSGLSTWYGRVEKDIPDMWTRHGWFPFYT